jgi:hypothetical protein
VALKGGTKFSSIFEPQVAREHILDRQRQSQERRDLLSGSTQFTSLFIRGFGAFERSFWCQGDERMQLGFMLIDAFEKRRGQLNTGYIPLLEGS